MDLITQIQNARVTNPMQAQAFPYRLYDSLIYPTGGSTQFSFFQTPVGQGVSSSQGVTAGSAKTYADTNMNLAGQLPSGMEFLIKSIEVSFDPGSSATANTFVPFPVFLFSVDATAANTFEDMLQAQHNVLSGGVLELNVLQQNYVRDAPLQVFPPKTRQTVDGAAASITSTDATAVSSLLRSDGRPWYLDGEGIPGISLQSAVNFEVIIKFPAAISVPTVSRLRVALDGYVLRSSQ